jgi:hypothetical protein
MTLLLGSFLVVDGKEAGAVKTGEALHITRLGIVARALRGSAQPHFNARDTTKTQLKITTKKREAKKDKQRRNILTTRGAQRGHEPNVYQRIQRACGARSEIQQALGPRSRDGSGGKIGSKVRYPAGSHSIPASTSPTHHHGRSTAAG